MASASTLASALDDFADATAQRLADTVIASLAVLKEPPRPPRVDRALYISGLLAETLGGFAVGGAASELIERVRAADAAAAGDRDRQRRLIGAVAVDADARVGERKRPRTVLEDAEARPLVDELGTRLLPAVLCSRPTLFQVASAIVKDVEATRAIEVLGAQPAIDAAGLRFGEQIEYGWMAYLAALSGERAPAIAHERSRELWKTWLRRVRRERPEVIERSARELGYVLRVA